MGIISRRTLLNSLGVLLGATALSLAGYRTAGSLENVRAIDSSMNSKLYPAIDWDYLNMINTDVCGWISIPQTNISQPIVKAMPGNPGYYLSHRWDKTPDCAGAVALDEECKGDLLAREKTYVSVLFGHAMNDGSLFSDVANYSDASWAQTHEMLFLQTPTQIVRYKHAFTEIIQGNEPAKQCTFPDNDAYRSWVAKRRKNAVVTTSEPIQAHLLVLCTCSSTTYSDERTLAYFFPYNEQAESKADRPKSNSKNSLEQPTETI